jgi:hypothetical protein
LHGANRGGKPAALLVAALLMQIKPRVCPNAVLYKKGFLRLFDRR